MEFAIPLKFSHSPLHSFLAIHFSIFAFSPPCTAQHDLPPLPPRQQPPTPRPPSTNNNRPTFLSLSLSHTHPLSPISPAFNPHPTIPARHACLTPARTHINLPFHRKNPPSRTHLPSPLHTSLLTHGMCNLKMR